MFIKTYTHNEILLTLYYQNLPGGEGEAKEILFYLLKETHFLPVSWLQKQIPQRMTDSQETGMQPGREREGARAVRPPLQCPGFDGAALGGLRASHVSCCASGTFQVLSDYFVNE